MLVESAGKRLLVDCGPDIRNQLLDADIGDLDHVVITHDHADHCHGLDDLRPIAQKRGPLPLHARPDVLNSLRTRFSYAFTGSGLYPPVFEPVEAGEALLLGNATICFVDQPHGNITSLGLRIEEDGKSAVYAIDYNALSEEMATLYEGCDVLISDCLQRRPHPTHAHLDGVLDWASRIGAGRLYLTHMSNALDYATLRSELPAWAEPAHDGLELTL